MNTQNPLSLFLKLLDFKTRSTVNCQRSTYLYLTTIPPFSSFHSSTISNLLSGNPFANKGRPLPAITGAMQILYSSNKSSRIRVSDKTELPNKYISFPPSSFNFLISPGTSLLIRRELFQTADFNVVEQTTFGIEFIKSAISPFALVQCSAMPSYVTRPNTRHFALCNCSRLNFSNSGPHTSS